MQQRRAALLQIDHREPEFAAGSSRRILLVVHGYPPNQTAGAEMQTHRKALWWQSRGHQVWVIAADPQSSEAFPFDHVEVLEDSVDGIMVQRVRFAAPDASRSLLETYRHSLLEPVLMQAIATFRPDLIYQTSGYIFGVLPLLLAARANIHSVLFVTDFWHVCQRFTLLRPGGACCSGPQHPADCAACRLSDRRAASIAGTRLNHTFWHASSTAGRTKWIGARLGVEDFRSRERAIQDSLRQASLVIANSQYLANWMVRLGIAPDRLLVVRQGIDHPGWGQPMSSSWPDAGVLRVLYLGQVSWHKGVDLVIQAVSRLAQEGKPIQLHVHGQATGDRSYRDKITRMQSSAVVINPPLDRAGLDEALHSSDILVVPSRWYENSPNVILEAFAAGVPVVAAGHGGMAEMVRDGIDGLHFRPGDANSLADALQRFFRDPQLLTSLRQNIMLPYDVDHEMIIEDEALHQLLHAK